MRLFTKPMTVWHKSVDSVGSDGRVTAESVEQAVFGAYRHRLATDTLDAGIVIVDEWIVDLPPDTLVAPGDEVDVDGDIYVVVSKPFPSFNHRTAVVHHLEVRMRASARGIHGTRP